MKKLQLLLASVFLVLLVLMGMGPYSVTTNLLVSWNMMFGEPPPLDTRPPRHVTMADRKLDIVLGHAQQGDSEALYELCRRFETADPERAFEWCLAGARDEIPDAQWMLASLYERGAGVERDPAAARQWRRKAADNGDARAIHMLALAHRDGTGMPTNTAEARRLLRTTAQAGYAPSIAALKAMGENVPPSPPDIAGDSGNAGEYTARVAGGFRHDMQYRFDQRRRRELTVSLSNLRPHAKWAPMFSVCVGAEAAGERVCLALTRFRGKKRLVANTRTLPADQHGKADIQMVGKEVDVGKPARIGVHVLEYLVYWTLDGELVAIDEVDYPIETLRLSCSGADCQVKFETTEADRSGDEA